MNKGLFFIGFALFLFQCTGKGQTSYEVSPVIKDELYDSKESEDIIPIKVKELMTAYPNQVKGYKNNYLLISNGDSIVWDDGKDKDFVTMLDYGDPEDMFKLKYDQKAEEPKDIMSDAGRSRCEQLFKAMYGHSAAEVRKNLVKVSWFGQEILFTKINGAADSLCSVAREISSNPDLLPYIRQSSSFYWRAVRGAKRQSAHSYGIAIDINTKFSNYWLWSNPNASETDSIRYINRVPLEIVRIFENHGFIWGGRWYHYDTMHFEFRPEFLINE